MSFFASKSKVYAFKKDKFISISFEIPKVKEIKKSVKTPTVKTTKPIESSEVNIENLFSDVWTKNIKLQKVPKKKLNKRLQEVLNKSKKSEKKEFTIKPKEVEKVVSTGTEVNEYLAKIQAIVYENFNPPQNSQGYTVKAVINLSAIGKLEDFRILRYSDNQLLNDECDEIKGRLVDKLFPINPNNRSGNYIIILSSKE
ncbi:MAG: TonB C-terminal domain-containing protein [Campylobacterota bacterium]|nr:TonB C-terminal domain-containing protein [Campylobacterota bacterium]